MSISTRQLKNGRQGYQVRVMRNGVSFTKYFSNRRKAEQHERKLLKEFGPPRSQKGIPKNTPPPRSTGVKRIVKRIYRRSGRKPSRVFVIYGRTAEGQPCETEISIAKWGEKRALRLAKKKKAEMDAKQMAGEM